VLGTGVVLAFQEPLVCAIFWILGVSGRDWDGVRRSCCCLLFRDKVGEEYVNVRLSRRMQDCGMAWVEDALFEAVTSGSTVAVLCCSASLEFRRLQRASVSACGFHWSDREM